MENTQIVVYYEFIKDATELFNKLYFHNEDIDESSLITLKSKFAIDYFDTHYENFKKELIANILEYKDEKIIFYYIKNTFQYFDSILVKPEIYGEIIRKNFERTYLLNLKKSLEVHIKNINSFVSPDAEDIQLSDDLKKIYFETLYKNDESFKKECSNLGSDNYNSRIKYEERFTINKLRKECQELSTNDDRKKLINDRLIEFRQWQLLYDEFILVNGISYRPLTASLYPNFAEHCDLEIERIHKFNESEYETIIANKAKSLKANNKNDILSNYKWKGNATEFIELLTALYQNNNFERKDGSKLSRTEIIDFFSELLNIEIKDVEGKLTRATSRIRNLTPFLDSLKLAFENYAEEKDEKQRKRK